MLSTRGRTKDLRGVRDFAGLTARGLLLQDAENPPLRRPPSAPANRVACFAGHPELRYTARLSAAADDRGPGAGYDLGLPAR